MRVCVWPPTALSRSTPRKTRQNANLIENPFEILSLFEIGSWSICKHDPENRFPPVQWDSPVSLLCFPCFLRLQWVQVQPGFSSLHFETSELHRDGEGGAREPQRETARVRKLSSKIDEANKGESRNRKWQCMKTEVGKSEQREGKVFLCITSW